MLLESTFRLVGFTLGAALHLFLVVLLARKSRPALPEKLTLAALSAAGLWHAGSAIALFHRASAGRPSQTLLDVLHEVAILGLTLAPALVWHLGVAWAGLRSRLAWPGYLAAPLAWWMLQQGSTTGYAAVAGAQLTGTAGFCLYAARRSEDYQRRFLRLLAASLLAIPLIGALAGSGSALLVLAALAPPLLIAWFIYRYHFLGVLISRRIVFALTLGVVFAFYLLLVKRIADFVEDEFAAFGALIELALIFAAALVWLPLYGWMTRFLAKRTQLYADFSKRLIEEAARILDLGQRVQFLAEELGRTFGLHRALLITSGEPRLRGQQGPPGGEEPDWPRIEALARSPRVELVRASSAQDPELAALLTRLGFQYLFPLWYEDHLTGLLLLDTSPHVFLDENEQIVLGLSRQISHSIETARVIEEKIGLERTVVQQEHLASLGKVAATIAHEIKNPLSSIKTLVQLMGEDRDVETRYSRDLSYMVAEIDRLNRSVQQLLSFSRPALETEQEVNLSDLLETTANVLARQYSAEQIRLEHCIEPSLTLRRANPEAVKQVVLNLVLNAIQASQPDSIVRLEARHHDGHITIAVSDQGPGIPPDLRDKIFEPFFTTKQKGTGLGLAIVRKNVRHLRGQIQVESPIAGGRGACVKVILPAE